MALNANRQENHLLARLPDAEWEFWQAQLEPVEMSLGHVLYEVGTTLTHIYFPTSAIVSLLYVMENGASAGIAVVGHEGIVGVSLFMGNESTASRAVVQNAGIGFKLKANLILEKFDWTGPAQQLILSYTEALITQMSQTATCNRSHTLDQQFCRWLLLSLDRSISPELIVTQDLIAKILGTRRDNINEIMSNLQKVGLISFDKSHTKVLDRARLEKRVCKCYFAIKKEYDRLLSPIPQTA